MNDSSPSVELRGVSKRFGDFAAVDDLHLTLGSGEFFTLLGPSGCGKTTTLRMIAGLERPTAGDIVIGGKRVNGLPPHKRDIAMVFQFYALYPALTVVENIRFPLHVEGLGEDAIAMRVDRVAEILHLGSVLDRLPGQISEGEKQRVAVARAIIRDPNCFLFDEPLSRLDVELRQTMRGQIKQVLSGLSKATVIVTHDQLEALSMADRIAVMRDGIIEQIATPHDVFARPANVFVASFIGTPQMNLVEAELMGVDGDKARIALEGAEIEVCPGPAAARLATDKVTIGIRPRALTPVDAKTPATIGAVAELIEPMGAETLIHARGVSGRDLRVVVPRSTRVKVGETLHLVADLSQTHVFDRDGKAVRS